MTLTMPQEINAAIELLENVGDTVDTIATNLGAKSLDRRSFRKYLRDYADRAASDAQLINASREDTLPICYAGLRKTTIPSQLRPSNGTAGGKMRAKYRLPLVGVSTRKFHLSNKLQHIKTIADQLYTEIDGKNIPFMNGGAKYRKPLCVRRLILHQVCSYSFLLHSEIRILSLILVIGMDGPVHRATVAHKQLSQSF
ncbi:unnamed protein product [Penicillium nalgiovense]|nr:unnamed protein product [Penicillium nalgiovense]